MRRRRRRRQRLRSRQFRRGNGLVLEHPGLPGRVERERAYHILVDGRLPVRDAGQEARLVAVVAAHFSLMMSGESPAHGTGPLYFYLAWWQPRCKPVVPRFSPGWRNWPVRDHRQFVYDPFSFACMGPDRLCIFLVSNNYLASCKTLGSTAIQRTAALRGAVC